MKIVLQLHFFSPSFSNQNADFIIPNTCKGRLILSNLQTSFGKKPFENVCHLIGVYLWSPVPHLIYSSFPQGKGNELRGSIKWRGKAGCTCRKIFTQCSAIQEGNPHLRTWCYVDVSKCKMEFVFAN